MKESQAMLAGPAQEGGAVKLLYFAVRRAGRWIGVARIGADEHRTIAGYDTRREAIQAAREMAARKPANLPV